MPPDLNTVPPSPYSGRRASRTVEPMAPPAVPFSSPAAVSVGQLSRDTVPSTATSSGISSGDNTGVGIGPGPLRHPRPLTAADLHMQLEKEQEAVVNRLTRELSLLRQQSASVASTTSSTSTGLADLSDHNTNHLLSGVSRPTPSRRHRSSSSLSTRSANTANSGLTGISASTIGTTGGIAGSTFSGIAPARDSVSHQSYQPFPGETLSRHDSVASSRRSGASSPSLASSSQQGYLQHTNAFSPRAGYSHATGPSGGPTSRFEETAHHRSELETVKRENESLRRRVRELERSLINRQRQLDRARNSSHVAPSGVGDMDPSPTSGTSAVSAGQLLAGSEESDDGTNMVHVGESAGSVGVGGGI